MKFGVKTFSNNEFLKAFENTADFFEIQAIEKNNYDFLKKFKLPLVIHAQHQEFGINNADKSIFQKNLKSINFARKLADKYNAKKIILHPGDLLNKDCSEKQAISFIKNLEDKRIIIENLSNPKTSLCTTPEQTKKILKQTKAGFCFDINHTIVTSLKLKKDYMQMIKKFIKLKPVHYHLGGQKISRFIKSKDKTHLSFKNSNIDLGKILKLIPKNVQITLEVTTNIKKTQYDLNLIKGLTS